jgi:hypothetical protein
VRELAAEKQVLLIDLYDLTLRQAEALGPQGCLEIDARDKEGKPKPAKTPKPSATPMSSPRCSIPTKTCRKGNWAEFIFY